MTQILKIESAGRVAVLTFNRPPVNAMGQPLREAMVKAVEHAEADPDIDAIVFAGSGRMFSAGADIREFDAPPLDPILPDVIDRIEACAKPVAAALHGTVLGGGFELAMGCHYRLAAAETKIGLPEVNLGIIPGAGGTQRLPRLIGASAALEMITSGRHVKAQEALVLGAIDEVVDGDVVAAAVQRIQEFIESGKVPVPTADRTVDVTAASDADFDAARAELAKKRRGFDAPQAAVTAVQTACTTPFRDGLAREREMSVELKASLQSKAQRHLFFAERTAFKIPDIPKDTPVRGIERAGVVGAGTMGAGIALCLLGAGVQVVLVDTGKEALNRGASRIRSTIQKDVDRGRMTTEAAEQRLALLTVSTDIASLKDSQLVIEAVFESLELKRQIFSSLSSVCASDAILATNTSTLDINAIADAATEPERVIGTHFFSPANIMKLLEVVRGDVTASGVIATTMAFGRTIGKTPVLSGVGYGFIGNRMLEDYVRESQMLLLEGATPAQVDGALEKWGMAMGPCAVMDLAGQDVSFLTRDQNRHLLPDDPRYYAPGDLMNAVGRFGQKAGKGFYAYPDGRTRVDDAEAVDMIRAAARELGVEQRSDISDQEILDRCLHALINRGAQLLDDRIAIRASDINVVWAAGYGFPAYRGGPMFHGDAEGLSRIVASFGELAARLGNDFGYWTPAPLLSKLAKLGQTFADWDREHS
jgi:3-hydroxyacyl-CoA dehydrogenase